MLAYFIIGLAVLAALLIGGHSLASADPRKLARALKITAAVILAALAGFFALTGKFAFAPPLILVAIMLLRNRPIFGGGSRPSPGQKSDVKTDWLQASLNHDTGEMDAAILRGQFKGKKLSELTLQQLLELEKEAASDEQTMTILHTFLDRYFSEETETKEQQTRARSAGGAMSQQEALEILELQGSASAQEIKSAHRRLMKKFHPDHNGSDYMAAKINEAKELLLKTK